VNHDRTMEECQDLIRRAAELIASPEYLTELDRARRNIALLEMSNRALQLKLARVQALSKRRLHRLKELSNGPVSSQWSRSRRSAR
jgi:hypothetical protein